MADQDYGDYWDAIHAAVMRPGDTEEERQSTFARLRRLISSMHDPAYLCPNCGRLFVYDEHDRLREYTPVDEDASRELFRSRRPQSESNTEPDGVSE